MATVTKNFKIKYGLTVEGSSGTIGGHDILTKSTADQNYIIGLIGGAATSLNTPDTVVLRDANGDFAAGTITADLIGDVTGNVLGNVTGDVTGTVSSIANHSTTDLAEGTNLYFTNQRALDATAAAYDAAGAAAQALSDAEDYTDNAISALDTDDIEEGTTNLYYTDARARGAVSGNGGIDYNSTTGVFSADLGYGLELDANNQIQIDDAVVATDQDVSDAIDAHNVASGVHGVTGDIVGTTDTQTLSNKTLGSNLDAGGFKVTGLAEPTNASDAATKGYVDSVAEGLHVHASAVAATTGNIDLATGGLLTVDGVTLVAGDRVLVRAQNAPAENGIYVAAAGAWSRAADYNAAAEVDPGDFVFVSGGTLYNNTGWVQENAVTTLGTDPISFVQFSGAGTFTAGNGLTLVGTEFAIDTDVTATKTYVDNEVGAHSDLTTGVHGVTGDVVGTTDVQTLTNKTLGTGTVLGDDLDAVNTYKIVNLVDPTSAQDAATKKYVDDEVADVQSAVDNLTTADVAENVAGPLYFTDQRAVDAVADAIDGGVQTNISVTYNNVSGKFDFVAENGVADSTTDDLDEGTTNLYFTETRARNSVSNGDGISYNASTGVISANIGAGLEISGGAIVVDTDSIADQTFVENAVAAGDITATPAYEAINFNDAAKQVAATQTVATAGSAVAYSWAKANYRTAEFLVKFAHGDHTEVSKIVLTMDALDNIAITEYAIVGTNGSLGTVSATVSGTDVQLLVTTANNSTVVTAAGTLLI